MAYDDPDNWPDSSHINSIDMPEMPRADKLVSSKNLKQTLGWPAVVLAFAAAGLYLLSPHHKHTNPLQKSAPHAHPKTRHRHFPLSKRHNPVSISLKVGVKAAVITASIPHFTAAHFALPTVEQTPAICHGDKATYAFTDHGDILPMLSSNFNCPLRSASTTKVMTILLVLEAVRNGKLSLDSKLPVSAYAHSRERTHLGLTTNNYITTRDALIGTAVYSANDAAVVLAEAVGGTETNFAKMMTIRAHELGATNATFDNASGLPTTQSGGFAAHQKMTARDLATMFAYAINEFPGNATHHGFLDYFAPKNIQVAGAIRQHSKNANGSLPNQDKSKYTGKTGDSDTGGRARNIIIEHSQGGRSVIIVAMGANPSLRAAENLAEINMKKAFQIITGQTPTHAGTVHTLPARQVHPPRVAVHIVPKAKNRPASAAIHDAARREAKAISRRREPPHHMIAAHHAHAAHSHIITSRSRAHEQRHHRP